MSGRVGGELGQEFGWRHWADFVLAAEEMVGPSFVKASLLQPFEAVYRLLFCAFGALVAVVKSISAIMSRMFAQSC